MRESYTTTTNFYEQTQEPLLTQKHRKLSFSLFIFIFLLPLILFYDRERKKNKINKNNVQRAKRIVLCM